MSLGTGRCLKPRAVCCRDALQEARECLRIGTFITDYKPVVASAKGGIPEVVEDGVTGRLVPWGDETRLGDALLEVLSDPAKAASWAERAPARIVRDFSWAGLVEGTVSLLQQVAESRM